MLGGPFLIGVSYELQMLLFLLNISSVSQPEAFPPCCEVQHRWYVKVCAALCVFSCAFLKVEGNICLAFTVKLK